jgi:hypothetical protein
MSDALGYISEGTMPMKTNCGQGWARSAETIGQERKRMANGDQEWPRVAMSGTAKELVLAW